MATKLCLTRFKEFEDDDIRIQSGDSELNTIFDYEFFLVDLRQFWNYTSAKRLADKKEEIVKFLNTGGVLFVICPSDSMYEHSRSKTTVNELDFLPVVINSEKKRGSTIKNVHPVFKKILNGETFRWCALFSEYPDNSMVLAENRAGDAISIAFPLYEGYVIILPTIRSGDKLMKTIFEYIIENYKKIVSQLQNIGEVSGEFEPPQWMEKLLSPEERGLIEQHDAIEEKIDKYVYFKKLFYETGSSLERTVKKTFQEFGIKSERLGEGTVPDLEIELSRGLTGIVEIKGVKGKINLDGLRQLFHYYGNKKDFEKQNVKGVFVANWNIEKPLEEREEPFGEGAVELANKHGFCLLTTVNLYRALEAFWKGKITKEEIVKKIESASGICELI